MLAQCFNFSNGPLKTGFITGRLEDRMDRGGQKGRGRVLYMAYTPVESLVCRRVFTPTLADRLPLTHTCTYGGEMEWEYLQAKAASFRQV